MKQVNFPFNVSVVIPTYNRRAVLLRAIQSVLEQEVPAHEILVVDDGSNDGTSEIDFSAMDSRIRFIRLRENRGGAVARNTGIQNATGNWIAFLDSDDLWFPDALKRQKTLVDSQGSPDFFVCGNIVCRKSDGSEHFYNSRPPQLGEDLSEYFLVHGCSFPIHSLLIPSHALQTIKFDERLKRHQDWDLVLRLVKSGFRYVYSHEAVGIYVQGMDEGRVSRSKGAAPTLYWFEIGHHFLSSAACSYYYTRNLFAKHVREKPSEALRVVSRLALTDTRSFRFTMRAITRLAYRLGQLMSLRLRGGE